MNAYSQCDHSREGKANTKRDYAIHGNEADRVLNAFGAIAAIIVCNSSGLLLEIQVCCLYLNK